jgi:hypothetical protein
MPMRIIRRFWQQNVTPFQFSHLLLVQHIGPVFLTSAQILHEFNLSDGG